MNDIYCLKEINAYILMWLPGEGWRFSLFYIVHLIVLRILLARMWSVLSLTRMNFKIMI